ncbi:MotA/TolQ/ExbB proton channel [Shewanella piezotolerans WP3]|uniref:MotA/TolQ/ExbB proton channel n=1 Tax=Shewanella piezotolerans (strain WP3 / JCM 13877) TaxID=225849 RepID=B8CV94_SHEPW|nr:MotA/TolQ/ExbB proton channel family protein [Shewanella piezotolerans]ACJ31570.1 MotA/TolQ/ExbB proton channel [Shewanella piezotolerans WP3]
MRRVKMLGLSLVMLVAPLWGNAAPSIAQISMQFEQRLAHAQQRHQQVTEQLLQQRKPQLQQLQQLESQLIVLRQQLTGRTRAKDEQFMSLQSLQQRLSQWQQQSRYVENLLARYLGSGIDVNDPLQFSRRLTALKQATNPAWQKAEVVALDGRMVKGTQLTLGPLSWFVNGEGQGFIVDTLASPAALIMPSPQILSDPLAMPVDISQDKAIRIAANKGGWLAKLDRGGIWVYPIVILGGLALLVALIKLFALTRMTKLQPQLAQRALDGEQPDSGGWQQQLFELANSHRHWPHEALADKLHHQLLQWKSQLDSKMVMLAATAAVAPLLGLLGTVSGMIHTFEMMNLFGNQDQNMLAGGISEALVTTELGLVVAVPTLLLHAYINRRHQAYLAQLEADTVLLAELSRVNREAL